MNVSVALPAILLSSMVIDLWATSTCFQLQSLLDYAFILSLQLCIYFQFLIHRNHWLVFQYHFKDILRHHLSLLHLQMSLRLTWKYLNEWKLLNRHACAHIIDKAYNFLMIDKVKSLRNLLFWINSKLQILWTQ